MKIQSFVIVAVILIGLLAYIVSFEAPRLERREAEKMPFHNVGKGQIKSIEIKAPAQSFKLVNLDAKSAARPGAKEDELRMVDAVAPASWTVEGVEGAQLDEANLNSVITQLSKLDIGAPLPSTELDNDLKLYGLTDPALVVTVERLDRYGQSQVVKFEFGKKSDYLGKRYVRYTRADGTQNIFLTDDLLFFAANRSQTEFRKKDPVALDDSEIVSAKFSGSSVPTSLSFEKVQTPQAVMRWRLKEPLSARADQAKIAELLRAYKNLKAKEFYDGAAAQEKRKFFASPNIEAEFDDADSATEPLKIVIVSVKEADKDKVYFTVSNRAPVFEAEAVPPVTLVDPTAFRETQHFDIDVDAVSSFKVEGTLLKGFSGVKKDEKWKIGEKEGDEAFIRQWLLDLKNLKVSRYPKEAADFGFATPALQVQVTVGVAVGDQNAAPNERKLVIGAPVDKEKNFYYAATDDLSEAFIISASELTKITPKEETLTVVPTAVPTASPAPSAIAG